jgi:hypothetical protein
VQNPSDAACSLQVQAEASLADITIAMLVHDFKLSHNQTKRLLQTLKDEQFRDSYLKDGVGTVHGRMLAVDGPGWTRSG